jgi:LEA14-like dessication related protein
MRNPRALRGILLFLIFCAPLTLTGCAFLQSLAGLAPRPTADVTGVRLADLSFTDVTLVFDVAVKNPYTVALPLVNVDYKLASQGQTFLDGRADLQGSIPPAETKTLSLPTKVTFAGLLQVLQSIRPGAVVPYQSTLGLSVDVPQLGRMRLPLAKEGQLPIPTVPAVSIASVSWQNLSIQGATGLVRIRVGNTNQFPVDLAAFQYALKLGGLSLANGAMTNAASLAAGTTQEIGISVSVSTAQVGLAAIQLLQGSSGTCSLAGALAIGTPYGALSVPLNVTGTVPFLR